MLDLTSFVLPAIVSAAATYGGFRFIRGWRQALLEEHQAEAEHELEMARSIYDRELLDSWDRHFNAKYPSKVEPQVLSVGHVRIMPTMSASYYYNDMAAIMGTRGAPIIQHWPVENCFDEIVLGNPKEEKDSDE